MSKSKIYIILTVVFLTIHLALARIGEVNDKTNFYNHDKDSIIDLPYKQDNSNNFFTNNEEIISKKRNLQTVIISNFTTSYIVYISIIIGLEILNITMLLILCCRNYFLNTDYC